MTLLAAQKPNKVQSCLGLQGCLGSRVRVERGLSRTQCKAMAQTSAVRADPHLLQHWVSEGLRGFW